MHKDKITEKLYAEFMKWYKINYWHIVEKEPTEKHLKQYLGYFGINRCKNE